MYELSIKDHICSAHLLRGYEGKCKNLHGHTWKIEVCMVSETLNEIGLVADFAILKKKLKEFLVEIDHVCLNDLPYFQEVNPSTENIAKYIYQNFAKQVEPLKVSKVCVWESETASVTYYE